jgi:adenylyltransferase/sulfurtransferase
MAFPVGGVSGPLRFQPAITFQLIIESRDFSMNDLEITPAEAKGKLERGDGVLLVDVREPWEFEICRIEGAKLIPMGTVPANLQALDTDDDVICYCHHGMRSLDVAVWLRSQGVERAKSLAGGIDRWSAEIDPAVPRY